MKLKLFFQFLIRIDQAVGGRISKELTKIESPISGRLFSGLAGGAGYAAGGVPGAAAGALAPLAVEEVLRRYQLSNRVQSALAQPKITYKPSTNDALFSRIAALVAAKQQADKEAGIRQALHN